MQIKLQLTNKVHEGFLRLVMNSNKSGEIKISRTHDIGKYICSRVRYSNLPVRQSSGITLILPKTTLESGANYFLYFSVEDQKKINDFLDAEFNCFFKRFMLVGDQFDIKKITLINTIITKMDLLNDDKIFQNLTKSDYRERKKVMDFLLKTVQLAHV